MSHDARAQGPWTKTALPPGDRGNITKMQAQMVAAESTPQTSDKRQRHQEGRGDAWVSCHLQTLKG